jgi:hypothetical protein
MKMRFAKAVSGMLGMPVLLSGCGWFDGPPALEKLRAGAERAISPSDSLPAVGAHDYDAAIVPIDETRGGPAIGSVVAASGGQKAQLEKLEKEAAARDAEDRAVRERANAEKARIDAEKAKMEKMDKVVPGKQAGTGDRPGEPATQPVATPRTPVSATPVPPPPPADVSPSDPNSQTKPAGT